LSGDKIMKFRQKSDKNNKWKEGMVLWKDKKDCQTHSQTNQKKVKVKINKIREKGGCCNIYHRNSGDD
jgi:hypothetical protein